MKCTMNNAEILSSNAVILDNTRLYFELQGKDDSKPVKFTINYQKSSEAPYYLKQIDKEYEPNDEMLLGLTLDYSMADETVEMTRMSNKECRRNMFSRIVIKNTCLKMK